MTATKQKRRHAYLVGCVVLSSLTLMGRTFTGTIFDYVDVYYISNSAPKRNRSSYESPALVAVNSSYPLPVSLASQNNNQSTFPRICLDEPLMKLKWEWYNYSQSRDMSVARNHSKGKLLIAQYSAFGKYARLLELTSPLNKAYAEQWQHDIVILQGTTMLLPYDKNCTPPEERSRFNKVALLLTAIAESTKYDQVLILDADTLIYNFSVDVTQLLPDEYAMVAQRTDRNDPPVTRHINDGITLWNLRHPLTANIADDWDHACRDGIPDNRPFRGDQYYLRQVLKSETYDAAVWTVWDEFYYKDGTVIKHFQRSNARTWNETGLDIREERILTAAADISDHFQVNLSKREYYVNYTDPARKVPIYQNEDPGASRSDTITDDPDVAAVNAAPSDVHDDVPSCRQKRPSIWKIEHNSGNHSITSKKRILISQYSAFGSYARLLDATAPMNKLYARRWEHDVLIVQGTALVLETDDSCEPPEQRTRYNKLPILLSALRKKSSYDQVLLLDADAMIYNLSYDISELLPSNRMMAAQRVRQEAGFNTSNINNGVTLWNLHHPMTTKVIRRWYKDTVDGLKRAKEKGTDAHGDQHYLQRALKREKGAIQYVHALENEFRYRNGTVIKHFVRLNNNQWGETGLDHRAKEIAATREEVCALFPIECKNLVSTNYSSY